MVVESLNVKYPFGLASISSHIPIIDISFVSIKESEGIWEKIKAYLNDSFTWKSLIYLFIKFPLGIISFVVLVTLISVALSLIAVPILYHLAEIGVFPGSFCITSSNICFINSYLNLIMVGSFWSYFCYLFSYTRLMVLPAFLVYWQSLC